MGIRPILSALLRNSAGAILVSLQIAITLAIVVNAVYLTTQRVQLVGRPSGIDDQNIFSFPVEGFEKGFDFIAMVREDMALLRQNPRPPTASQIAERAGYSVRSLFERFPDLLSLSLAPMFIRSVMGLKGLRNTLNYGADRVRYLAPVPAGSRIRGRTSIAEVEDVPPDGLRVNYHMVIEIEGGKRPACVADLIALHYR